MSRELRLCPGVGGRKCGAFLSSLDRDPHPTCTRCRDKVCTRDLTCDICVEWSPAQWESFAKNDLMQKGNVHALQALSPLHRRLLHVRGLLRKSRTPRLLLPSLQEGRLRGGGGGSRDAPGAESRGASSPPARLRSSERGGSASGRSSGARKLASVSSAPSEVEEEGAARSQWTPLAHSASSVAYPSSSVHALRGGESRGSSEVRSRSLSSSVSQSSDRGTRKDRTARSRSGSSHGRPRRSRSRSASRSRSSGRERRRRDLSWSLSSRERLRSSDRYRSRRVRSRSLSRRDWSRSSDRCRSCWDSSQRDRSRRERSHPLLVGEVAVTARGHAIPLAALVTAHGHRCGRLSPVTVCGQGIEAGEPDVSNGRVWR